MNKSLEALEQLRAKYGLEEKDYKLYISVITSLKALEILKNYFYEEYKLPNGKVSLLFRLNDNKDLVLVKKELIYENVKNKN